MARLRPASFEDRLTLVEHLDEPFTTTVTITLYAAIVISLPAIL